MWWCHDNPYRNRILRDIQYTVAFGHMETKAYIKVTISINLTLITIKTTSGQRL